jgi:hypothetical protein
MIEVYLNKRAMKKNGHRVYSLRNNGSVIQTSNFVLMKDVKFVVQPSGRLETVKRLLGKSHPSFASKTVHAFLRGTVLNYGQRAWSKGKELGLLGGDTVVYNPLEMQQFSVVLDDISNEIQPVINAKLALCHRHQIHILQ